MPISLQPLPDAAAIRALKARGATLLESWDWRDVGAEIHKQAFTVAKSAGFDILGDVHASLEEALANGETFQSWAKRIRPTLAEKGWWGRKKLADPVTGEVREVQLGSPRRLRTIYDTNMRVSHAQGRWERTERLAARRPYLRYVATLDERTRASHRSWHGTVLRWDDPWWDTHYPPNGWRCRCSTMQLGEADMKRYGFTPTDPAPNDGPGRVWTNPRTGETQVVPPGIDPGWAHNPGKIPGFAINPAKYDLPGLGHAAAEAAVQSPEFAALVGGQRQGAIPVGYDEKDLAARLGSQVRRVDLSAETMAKQQANHVDLTLAEYQLLPQVIREGTIITQGTLKVAFFHEGDRWYKAVVKATGRGDALYLVSFHRIHGDGAREIAREMARGGKVVRE